MAYPVMPLGFLGSQGDQDSYRIERSLRFNSADSAYLNRTFSTPTSQSVFTISLWVKLGILGTSRQLFGVSTNHSFGLTSGDALNLTFAGTSALTTTALFRDPSAWYHIVWTQNSNAHTIYVNGVSISTATATSNTFNTAVAHQLGSANTTNYFNGYLAEINFIDGQALTPSSFGETDPITGRWKAKSYGGTYGTNGFYLKFADNSGTTSTTLGKDSSPNGNNWTPNNFSVTAGAGNDSLVDSPTNYGTDTGVGGEVRGNYATWNRLDSTALSMLNGNLDFSTPSSGFGTTRATIGLNSGRWYWEVTYVSGTDGFVGIMNQTDPITNYVGQSSTSYGYYTNGNKYNNTSPNSYGSSYTNNNIIGVALDLDTGTIVFYKNGVSQGTAYSSIPLTNTYLPAAGDGTNGAGASFIANFGQRPFAYTAPAGFRSLCTTNLPTPTIKKPSSAMDVVTYTGNGSARSITGLGFSPDLVWIKGRSGATDHAIYDSVRGVQKDLGSNLTTDETTQTQGLTAFNSDGFDIGTLAKLNTNTSTYVAWAWDRAAIDGLDIVSYTGNGANRTIAHNLGVAPKMIIVKARTTAGTDQGWPVWHESIPNTNYLMLDTTALSTSGATYWNSTSPTASVFSLGTNAAVNANNDTYIAYLFAEVDGFSKFGSYTGNSSADGPFVWCGFRPRWVMTKSSGGTAYAWIIHDTARNQSNVADLKLVPDNGQIENGSSVGGTTFNTMDILSNGFKLRSSNVDTNQSSGFIFAAFAESPFKYARAR